jgi:hypothetical protein
MRAKSISSFGTSDHAVLFTSGYAILGEYLYGNNSEVSGG